MATRSHGRQSSYRRGNIQVEGNTVRKIPYELVPEKPKKLSNAARRNREKAAHMSLPYVMFLAMAILATAFICVKYLGLQSDITSRQRHISTMESDLNDKKLANDEEYARIMGAVDLEKIKAIAMNELGMSYPSKDQIVSFQDGDSDYVRQYADIPK